MRNAQTKSGKKIPLVIDSQEISREFLLPLLSGKPTVEDPGEWWCDDKVGGDHDDVCLTREGMAVSE